MKGKNHESYKKACVSFNIEDLSTQKNKTMLHINLKVLKDQSNENMFSKNSKTSYMKNFHQEKHKVKLSPDNHIGHEYFCFKVQNGFNANDTSRPLWSN